MLSCALLFLELMNKLVKLVKLVNSTSFVVVVFSASVDDIKHATDGN